MIVMDFQSPSTPIQYIIVMDFQGPSTPDQHMLVMDFQSRAFLNLHDRSGIQGLCILRQDIIL